MTQLTWNDPGSRFFEAGVDRGVLYTSDGVGVAWNGLTSVNEAPSGGEATPYYLDGVKYLNIAKKTEYQATIEAYTYPQEFAEHNGWVNYGEGLMVDEQRRKPFGFSYRTRLGNDVDSHDHGYKIHIVYGALAAPTQSAYSTLGESVDPNMFSWSITTQPLRARDSLLNLSHIVVDSTKTNPTQLSFIEQYLYGTASQSARLPPLDLMFTLFDSPIVTLHILANPDIGLSPVVESDNLQGDLRGRILDGLLVRTVGSQLTETDIPGLYTLEQ